MTDTSILFADPGDEQAERREFEAWAAVDRSGSANNVSLYREDCEWYVTKIAPLAGFRIVPCRVIVEEP